MSVTLHHLENSRSHRILWLFEELGVDYELVEYERDPKTRLAPRELREVHPLGKSPVITHDGKTIAESGAIIEHIVDNYDDGTLRPEPGTDDYDRYRYFMHYAEGSAMSPFLLAVVFTELPKQGPFLAKPVLKGVSKAFDGMYISKQVRLHMKFWESELSTRPWFAGESFSAADIQMIFALQAARRYTRLDDYPKIADFLERAESRRGWKAAVERGGELNL